MLGGAAVLGNVSSFGVDAAGELYVVSYSRGLVLEPRVKVVGFQAVFRACAVGERAYEWAGRDRGIFSVALEEAIRGVGEGPKGDGQVTLTEVAS